MAKQLKPGLKIMDDLYYQNLVIFHSVMMVICITSIYFFPNNLAVGLLVYVYPDMADQLATSPLNQLHVKQVVANITQSLGQTEAEEQQLRKVSSQIKDVLTMRLSSWLHFSLYIALLLCYRAVPVTIAILWNS